MPIDNSVFDDTYLKMSTIYNTPVVQRLRIATPKRRNSHTPRRTESPWRGSFRKELDVGCIEQKTSSPFARKETWKKIAENINLLDDRQNHEDAIAPSTTLWQEEIKEEGDDSQKKMEDFKKGRKQLRGQEKYDTIAISLGEEKKQSIESAEQSGLTLRGDKRRAHAAKLDVSTDWIHKTRPILTRLAQNYGSSSPRKESRSSETMHNISKLQAIQSPRHPLLSPNIYHVKSQRLPSLGAALQARNDETQFVHQRSYSGSLSPIKLSQRRHASF